MAECSDSSMSNNTNTQKQRAVIVSAECPDEGNAEKAPILLIEEISDERFPESYTAAQEELRTITTLPLTRSDIVILLIYILMLEEGFVPAMTKGAYSHSFHKRQILRFSRGICKYWKAKDGMQKFDFILSPWPSQLCTIICVTSLDDLIVNCHVKAQTQMYYSILIDPSLYVIPSTTNLRSRYQNINQLAVNFKNKISNLAKAHILRSNGMRSSTIQDLPPELVEYLNKFVYKRAYLYKALAMK